MIHLDTHVVVWLYEGRVDRFPAAALARLRARRPVISPMVRLELALLHEIGRISQPAPVLLDALAADAGLAVAESDFARVAAIAAGLTFTRDPFDRMIAAHALADDVPLLTKDAGLLAGCRVAVWG